MKKARLTHEVWMGFPDYEGNIHSVSVIARFCSSQRAMGYLKSLLNDHPYENNTSPRYGYKKSGDDNFAQIADMHEGEVWLSSPMWMLDDDGLGYIKGAIK